MDCKYENFGETGVLTFDGELSAHCSDDLMEVLMMSLGSSEHLVVDLENVTALDLSCLKMFDVACRTSERLKKTLTLKGNTVGELKQPAAID